jgi:phosphocarrier protein
MIIKLVEGFKSKITLDGSDARSILSIMTLAATKGRKLELIVDGEDEEKAAEAIEHLFKDGFFEKQSKRRSFNEKKQSRN